MSGRDGVTQGNDPGAAAVLRATALLVLVAAAVAVTTVLAPSPGAAAQDELRGAVVPVPSGDAVLVCAAPPVSAEQALGEGAATSDDQLTGGSEQVTALRALALTDEPITVSGEPTSPAVPVPVPVPGVVVAETQGAATTVLRVPSRQGAQSASASAALRTVRADDGDLAGLSATGCARPAREAWLLGSGTAVGHSAQLVLANPGPVTAGVDLVVLTEDGPVQPEAGADLALAPGAQRRIFVEGLAPGRAAVAVGVLASAGRVAATLQDTVLEGLDPGGTDAVTPTVPARRLVLPGVTMPPSGPDAVLRLATPGEQDAVVSWRLLTPDGPVSAGGDVATTVPAGSVVEVPLTGDGVTDVAVVVDADVPVVAAVRTRSGEPDGARELAWAGPAQPLGGPVVVPLPADEALTWRLVLAGDGRRGELAEVVPIGPDGARGSAVEVEVPAGATATVTAEDVDAGGAVGLLLTGVGGGGQVCAALALASGDPGGDGPPAGTAVVPVAAAPSPPQSVTVRPSPPGRWP